MEKVCRIWYHRLRLKNPELSHLSQVNPLTDDKIFDLPKLKAFADDKSNVTQNIKVVFYRIENIMGNYRIENIMGKEENVVYQHFLHFP